MGLVYTRLFYYVRDWDKRPDRPSPPQSKVCVGYTRRCVPGFGPSVKEQAVAIEEWAEKNGLAVGLWVNDGRRSAMTFGDRRLFAGAVAVSRHWKAVLAVYSVEQSIRCSRELAEVLEICGETGFVAVKDKYVDTTHGGWEVIRDLILIGARAGSGQGPAKKQMMRRKRQATKLGYGWKMRHTLDGDRIVVDWPKQEIRRSIWRWRTQGWSLSRIRDHLLSEKVPAPSREWTILVVRDILRSKPPVLKPGDRVGDYNWKAARDGTKRAGPADPQGVGDGVAVPVEW